MAAAAVISRNDPERNFVIWLTHTRTYQRNGTSDGIVKCWKFHPRWFWSWRRCWAREWERCDLILLMTPSKKHQQMKSGIVWSRGERWWGDDVNLSAENERIRFAFCRSRRFGAIYLGDVYASRKSLIYSKLWNYAKWNGIRVFGGEPCWIFTKHLLFCMSLLIRGLCLIALLLCDHYEYFGTVYASLNLNFNADWSVNCAWHNYK